MRLYGVFSLVISNKLDGSLNCIFDKVKFIRGVLFSKNSFLHNQHTRMTLVSLLTRQIATTYFYTKQGQHNSSNLLL